MSTSATPDAPEASAPWLPGPIAARLRVIERLAPGAWRVERRDDHRPYALKVLEVPEGPATTERFARLKREQAELKALGHPGIVPYVGALAQDGRILLERLLVAGEPVDSHAPRAAQEAVAIARRVASILARAHAAGLTHLGLKPSNVLVETRAGEAGAEPFVSVVDWGAARLGAPTVPDDEAPGAAADLRALGLLLARMLTGRPPAAGEPAALPDDAPPVLSRLLARLLTAEPAHRYRSARGLAFDLGEIESALRRGEPADTLPLGTADLLPDGAGAAVLVGRERALSRLLRDLERAAGGQGALVLIAGERGVGKSRLAAELLERARRGGGPCLVGRSDARATGAPYGPLLDALSGLARAVPGLGRAERERLVGRLDRSVADLGGEVLRLVPALAPWLPEPVELPTLPPDRATFRCREALGRVVAALGEEGRPALLLLEDIEHADAATLRWLEHLEVGPLKEAPLLVLATCDDARADDRSGVRELVAGRRLELAPLGAEGARALARELLGGSGDPERPETGPEHLAAEAGGQPGAILERATELRARSLGLDLGDRLGLATESAAGTASVAALALAAAPLAADEVARVADVGRDEADHALRRAEMRGLVERELAAEAPAQHRFRAESGAREALLEAVGEERVRAMATRLEALLAEDGADARASTGATRPPLLSGALALDLAVARHDVARVTERAAWLARAAVATYAPKESLAALALVAEHAEPEARDALRAVEARALELAGRTREAVAADRRCFEEATDRAERVAILERIARVELDAGRAAESIETLSRAFAEMGLRPPAEGLAARADLSVQRVVQGLQRLNESQGLTSVPGRAQDAARVEVRLLERLAAALAHEDPTRASAARLRALNLAARLGPSETLAHLLEGEAEHWRRSGELTRAVELARRALATREQSGSLSGAAAAHVVLGRALLSAGRIEESLAHLEEAVRGFEDQGDLWGMCAGLEALGEAFGERGDWHRAIELWERLQRLARRLAEDGTVTRALARLALAYARVGDRRHALELVVIEPREDTDAEVAALRDLHVGQALVALGRHEQGARLLERARDGRPGDGERGEAFELELAEARIEAMLGRLSETAAAASSAERPAELGTLLAAALEGSKRWPCLRARALRLQAQAIRAGLEHERGEDGGWWLAVSRSLEAARAVSARGEEAITLLETAAGLEERGDPRARGYRARAERLLEQGGPSGVPLSGAPVGGRRRPGPPRTTRVVSRKEGTQRLKLPTPVPSRVPEVLTEKRRWKSLLTLNQAISSILQPAELLDRVVELGLEVTGAQRGFLVLLESDTAPEPHGLGPVPDTVAPERVSGGQMNLKVARLTGAAAGAAHGFGGSRSIVRSVITSGESVVRSDARADPTFGRKGSVASQHIRSVLAVPLKRGDVILGVLYVDNPMVAGLIRERERELLEVFATQAAIAIDNAGAYSEIAALKEQLSSENVRLKEGLREATRGGAIVGESPGIKKALDQAARVAPTQSTVLITGETGVGKEGFARAVHDSSTRRDGPLIKIDCAALPATLLESELFGHERGAFTGAERRRIGKFEMAHGGTVFLDEIGNIPLDLQVKLLQVLENRTFFRLGGRESIEVDVRVVAATNRDLATAVREGSFREDLFYRLNVVPIRIPPLRDRPGDVPLLVEHFVERFNRSLGRTVTRIPAEVMAALERYPWPGNVRELEHLIERSLVLADGEAIELVGLPTAPEALPAARAEAVGAPAFDASISLAEGIRRYKIARLTSALRASAGNRAEAARELGIHRQNLSRLLKQLDMDPDT